MLRTRICVFVVSLLVVFHPLAAQQPQLPAASDAQGSLLIRRALAALAPSAALNDITLSGNARRVAGSDDETGTVVVRAAAKSSRVDLSFPSGVHKEARSASATGPAANWSGPDGATRPVAYHNAINDAGLLPAFVLASFAGSQNAVITLVGQETRNNLSVLHLSARLPTRVEGRATCCNV